MISCFFLYLSSLHAAREWYAKLIEIIWIPSSFQIQIFKKQYCLFFYKVPRPHVFGLWSLPELSEGPQMLAQFIYYI